MLSRKTLLNSFAALLLLGSTLNVPALAVDTIHEIHLDECGTRLLNLSIGNVNILKAINPTDTPVLFTVPAYHVVETIPAHDHKNIKLNTAQSMEPYAFYTVGGGTKIQTLTESSSWSTSTKSMSLDKIINYNTDYEVINDPEPLYYDNTYYQEPVAPPPAKPAKRMIRGYW